MKKIEGESFAERLMGSEVGSEELRRRYEEDKRALVERRLTPVQKWMGWLAMPLYVWLIGGLGYRLLTDPTWSREWVVLEGVCAVFLLALGLWILRALFRGGRVTRRDDQVMEWANVIGLGAMSFALFEVALSLDDVRAALRVYGCVTVLLVSGSFALLFQRLSRVKLETRVKLVELELRLDELARRVGDPQDLPGGGRP